MKSLAIIACAAAALSAGTLTGNASPKAPYGKLYPPNASCCSLELCHLKIYAQRPDQENASDQTTFFQEETSKIWTQFTVRNLLCGIRSHTYHLTFRYIYENERVIACHSLQCTIPKDWPYAEQIDTLTWSKPGQWPLGHYRVEVWIDNLCFATRSFSILHEDERNMMLEEDIVIEKNVEVVELDDDSLMLEEDTEFEADLELEDDKKPRIHAGHRWLNLPQTPPRTAAKKHAGHLRLNLP